MPKRGVGFPKCPLLLAAEEVFLGHGHSHNKRRNLVCVDRPHKVSSSTRLQLAIKAPKSMLLPPSCDCLPKSLAEVFPVGIGHWGLARVLGCGQWGRAIVFCLIVPQIFSILCLANLFHFLFLYFSIRGSCPPMLDILEKTIRVP